MRVHHLPAEIRALIFDIDLTLYSDRSYYDSQTDLLVRRYAELRGIGLDEAMARVEGEKERYRKESNGKSTSMGNILLRLGIPIDENVRWREQLFRPERYLQADERLAATMDVLQSRYKIAAVTNNPVSVGTRTLDALGIAERFSLVVGLDTCMISKPAEEPYRFALSSLGLSPEQAVSIGDRFTVDIEVPLRMGMGGILVESMEDVYGLVATLEGGDA